MMCYALFILVGIPHPLTFGITGDPCRHQVGQNYTEDKPYYRVGALQLQSNLSKDSDDATPPAWETMPPQCPTCQATIKGESGFSVASVSPYRKKEEFITSQTLTSDLEALAMARVVGTILHQQFRSRQITLPVPLEYMQNNVPFSTVYCHNGAFIMDNPAIHLASDGMELSFRGNYLGAIPVGSPTPTITPILSNVTPVALHHKSRISATRGDSFASTSPLLVSMRHRPRIQLSMISGSPKTISLHHRSRIRVGLGTSLHHRSKIIVTSKGILNLHHRGRIKVSTPPFIFSCGNSSVCGVCVSGGKVLEFNLNQGSRPYTFKVVASPGHTQGTGFLNINSWSQLPNSGMEGCQFFARINIGDTFTFTPTSSVKYLSIVQQNRSKPRDFGSPQYYFDTVCFIADPDSFTLTIMSF